MQSQEKLVSIIILNWNGIDYIEQCIQHILNQTYKPIELIVVDNGSTDSSAELVSEKYSTIKLLRNKENVGFAKGMNLGIALTQSEYIIPLNQDAFLDSEFVRQAVLAVESDPNLGMISGKVYQLIDGQKTTEIDYAGHFLHRRVGYTSNQKLNEPVLVFGPSGCCPFVKREMLEDVALAPGEYFDETYFALYEDLDLWFRAQLKGWKCLFVPTAVAWHVRSSSMDKAARLIDKPDFFQVHAFKNRYLTMIKGFPAGLLLSLFPYLFVIEVGMWLYYLIRSPRSCFNLARAIRAVWRLMPHAMQKRKQILSERKVSIRYLKTFFTAW